MPPTGLYWAAMKACHSVGLPWTDPMTGYRYDPPSPKRKTKNKSNKPRRSKHAT